MNTIKLCKDCKFCKPDWFEPWDRFFEATCSRHEPNYTVDNISGKKIKYQYKHCGTN